MARVTREFEHRHSGSVFKGEAYTDDGKVWRWVSNDSVIMLDVIRDYAIPADLAAQQEAYDKYVSDFLAKCRKPGKRRVSEEERSEARAAFGKGKRVVNVVTGQTYTT